MKRHMVFPTAALLCCAVSPAQAINIVTTYNPGGAGAVNPAFDNGATQLDAIFNAVEAYYEDIFEEGGHTLTINFWYTDLAGGLLGDHDFISADGNNRENVANIKIDTRVGTGGALQSYFFDATPTENEEFNMTQTLWRDIGAVNQADWYNFTNPIPDTFEVGFTGTATGGGAVGNIDMFTLVLHEVGHALGLSGASPGSQNEAGVDGDYDFDPNFVFGAALAADTVDQATDFLGHLDGNNMLMFPNLGGAGNRKLPSHTDLMAMAAGNQYLILDAPRREFYGGGDWNDAANWTGSRNPDANDDAYVRDSQGPGTVITASLSVNDSVQNLFVSEGANVDLNSFQLTAVQDVFVSDLDSDIFINPGGYLAADEVFIQNQAEIEMNGGTVDARRLVIGATAQLEGVSGGAMTIDVSQSLVNDGIIDVDSDAVMTFQTTGGAVWDLDGVIGDGQLFANDGDLFFDTGSLSDAFGGTITVGPGHFFRFDAAWTIQGGGVLNLDGGSGLGQAAQMTGGTITINGGTVNARDVGGDGLTDGVSEFGAPVTFTNGTVNVGADDTLNFLNVTTINNGTFTVAQDGSLNFNATTTVSGGTFNTFSTSTADGDVEFNGFTWWEDTVTINGVARQDGHAQVADGSPATINADIFDMDGNTGVSQVWTLRDDLTINADAIDTTGGYNGRVNILDAFATLTINTPSQWTMAGTLYINHGVNSTNTSIAGQDFTLSGTAEIDAWTGFAARTDITGDIVFQSANTVLSLSGGDTGNPNRLEGGTISGPGRLSFGTFDALVGFGSVTPSEISLGLGARLLAEDGTLTVNSASIQSSTFARIGTRDGSGTLLMNGTFDTSLVQAIELNGGALLGDQINNNGLVTGHGGIATDGFNNRGTITANNGTLNLSIPDAFSLDLDGTNEVGVINALAGTVRVTHNFAGVQLFDGTLNVGNGHFYRMDHDGIQNSGTVNLTGGNIVVPVFRQADTLNVSSLPSSIDADSVFMAGSNSSINANLFLIGETDVQAGATLSGTASLINQVGSNLQLMDGAELGVDLVNEGFMEVGDSPGTAMIRSSAQFTSSASYLEELGGSLFGQYDRLLVTESIDLDGSLRVLLTSGHVPSIGDAYEIISASLGLTGVFSTVLLPDISGVSLCLHYDANSLYLLALLPGDLNADGFVGIDDLNIVLGNWNGTADAGVWGLGDVNGDGFVGIDDLNEVLGNWNAGTPPTDIANIPEPGTVGLVVVLCGAGVSRRRERS